MKIVYILTVEGPSPTSPGGSSQPTEGPSTTEVCSSKMAADVSFVVDGSKSVTAANWELVKQFMNNVVDKFVIGDDQVSCS